MPALRQAGEAGPEKLRQIFLKAEADIIIEIGRLRSMGNADYHAAAALALRFAGAHIFLTSIAAVYARRQRSGHYIKVVPV